MSLKRRQSAIYELTAAADYSAKAGYLVTIAGNTATVNTSGTVPAKGVILEGAALGGKCSVGILGAIEGSVDMKAGGAITKGAYVVQHTDGSVITDPAAGARVVVGVAMETAASGDLIEVAAITPRVYAS